MISRCVLLKGVEKVHNNQSFVAVFDMQTDSGSVYNH